MSSHDEIMLNHAALFDQQFTCRVQNLKHLLHKKRNQLESNYARQCQELADGGLVNTSVLIERINNARQLMLDRLQTILAKAMIDLEEKNESSLWSATPSDLVKFKKPSDTKTHRTMLYQFITGEMIVFSPTSTFKTTCEYEKYSRFLDIYSFIPCPLDSSKNKSKPCRDRLSEHFSLHPRLIYGIANYPSQRTPSNVELWSRITRQTKTFIEYLTLNRTKQALVTTACDLVESGFPRICRNIQYPFMVFTLFNGLLCGGGEEEEETEIKIQISLVYFLIEHVIKMQYETKICKVLFNNLLLSRASMSTKTEPQQIIFFKCILQHARDYIDFDYTNTIRDDQTVLHKLVKNKWYNLVKLWLDYGASANVKNRENKTPFEECNCLEYIKLAANKMSAETLHSCLVEACLENNKEIVIYLIENFKHVLTPDLLNDAQTNRQRFTALVGFAKHIARSTHTTDDNDDDKFFIPRLLIESAKIRDDDVCSPFLIVCSCGDVDLAKFFFNYINNNSTACPWSARDNNGKTALLLAVESMEFKLVCFLLENGGACQINTFDSHQETSPLLAALGSIKLVKRLIDYGAKNLKNKSGVSPLLLAQQQRLFAVADLLAKSI